MASPISSWDSPYSLRAVLSLKVAPCRRHCCSRSPMNGLRRAVAGGPAGARPAANRRSRRLQRPGDCRRHPPSRGPVVLESRGALQRRRPEATGEEERETNWITKAAPTAPAAGGARVPVRQGSLALPRRGRARGVGAGPVPVSYTHLRAHETVLDLVCRL